LHLKAFKELGINIKEESGFITCHTEDIIGTNIHLDFPSVGATINIMLAATLANGMTVIDNAAKEPEIVNVATFLNNMGAKVSGAGTSTIKIKGVKELNGCFHEVIPDRIEAGTYIIAGALMGENLKIDNIIPEHLTSLTSKLTEAGADIKISDDNIICNKTENLKNIDITTYYYPGFPTDLQQPFSVFMTKCKGTSIIEENIYENRFMHVPYLNKMGAKIKIKDKTAKIKGISKLTGKKVVATDLRAGAALVIAGLIANGKTVILDAEHILRGYAGIVEKLTNVGADIKIEEV